MRNKYYSTVYQKQKLFECFSHLENSWKLSVITDTKSRGPRRAMISADGGLVFSTKAGRKLRLYLGTNSLRCKHILEEGKKDKVQKPGLKGHFSTGP